MAELEHIEICPGCDRGWSSPSPANCPRCGEAMGGLSAAQAVEAPPSEVLVVAGRWQCPECPKSYTAKSSLIHHGKTKHSLE